MSRAIEFERFLFHLQQLEEEGKKTESLQEKVWEKIKEEVKSERDLENE